MKTIGLIGGLSWHSTIDYYRFINEGVNARLGGYHSAKILMASVDLAEVLTAKVREEKTEVLRRAAKQLEAGGAELLLICANTPHVHVEYLQPTLSIPILHIADAVAAVVHREGMRKVGIVGTKTTIESTFYRTILGKQGIELVVPPSEDVDRLETMIKSELMLGTVPDATRQNLAEIIQRLHRAGAAGVILGCTEIPPVIDEKTLGVRCFDSTRIHAQAAIDRALGA